MVEDRYLGFLRQGSPNSSDRPPEHNSLKESSELLIVKDRPGRSDGIMPTRINRCRQVYTVQCDNKKGLRKRTQGSKPGCKRGAAIVCPEEKKEPDCAQSRIYRKLTVSSSQGVSETLSVTPSASPKNMIQTASVPKSILKKANTYNLARPIVGVSEQEIIDLRNTVAKPPTGVKKCKVSFQNDEPAPLGAQLKLGRQKKYATPNDMFVVSGHLYRPLLSSQSCLSAWKCLGTLVML